MKAFLRKRPHSRAGLVLPHEEIETADLSGDEEQSPKTPDEYTPRENAFDTALRLHRKLHRDSDGSHYSRDQNDEKGEDGVNDEDDEQNEDDSKPLPMLPPSPTDTITNASYLFWSTQRSKMWVNHVASSEWPTIDLEDGENNQKAFADSTQTSGCASKSKVRRPDNEPESQIDKYVEKKAEHEAENKAKVKSNAAKLLRRPKLTLQIPKSACRPMHLQTCQPCITSEERVEWKKNMF